jgi:hypothetical protein
VSAALQTLMLPFVLPALPPLGIILYSQYFQTTAPYWAALKTGAVPVHTDEVVCYKALIVTHKLIRDGHASVRAAAGR